MTGGSCANHCEAAACSCEALNAAMTFVSCRHDEGSDIAAVGVLGGACPWTEVASVAWGGRKPRNMCLSIRERLINAVCTCEVLSDPIVRIKETALMVSMVL